MLRLLAVSLTVAVSAGALVLLPAQPAGAAGSIDPNIEWEFASLLNSERTARGLPALPFSVSIHGVARDWSFQMASSGTLWHNPNMASQIGQIDPWWQSIGENVGVGYSASSLHQALMASSGHQANILGNWSYVAIGVVNDGGKLWVTQNFIRTSTPHTIASPAVPPKDAIWWIRNAASAGAPDLAVAYGLGSYQTLSCDWDGNGTDTIGVYAGDTFYLRNSNTPGSPDIVVKYGWAGVTAVCGDWNGDGKDTIGVYDRGQWLLRDINAAGAPHRAFSYGWSAAGPVVGDWNGDGIDGIGVYSLGDWYLRQTTSAGPAQVAAKYGYAGAAAVTGDWDGDGDTSIGVYDRGVWLLRQSTTPGSPQVAFGYGWSGARPVTGDWNGDGITGVAVIES